MKAKKYPKRFCWKSQISKLQNSNPIHRQTDACKFLKFFLIIVLLFFSFLLTGCIKNLGIADSQRLPTELPENYKINASANQIWGAVTEIVESISGSKILARSPSDYFLSWSEKITKWRDLGQDSAGMDFTKQGSDPNLFKVIAETTDSGISLTTVRIEETNNGCILSIHRVYFSDNSLAGVAHSRGDFERDFYDKLQTRIK